MPECHHCGRLLPTGELRRTVLGFVCKENGELGKASLCARMTVERRQAERERRAPRREAAQATGRAEA
jgi:hypothetical protein